MKIVDLDNIHNFVVQLCSGVLFSINFERLLFLEKIKILQIKNSSCMLCTVASLNMQDRSCVRHVSICCHCEKWGQIKPCERTNKKEKFPHDQHIYTSRSHWQRGRLWFGHLVPVQLWSPD
jgi:hypothetical protein